MKTANLTMTKMNYEPQAFSRFMMPGFCYAFFQTGSLIGIGLRM